MRSEALRAACRSVCQTASASGRLHGGASGCLRLIRPKYTSVNLPAAAYECNGYGQGLFEVAGSEVLGGKLRRE
jgi:hypothetical protein